MFNFLKWTVLSTNQFQMLKSQKQITENTLNSTTRYATRLLETIKMRDEEIAKYESLYAKYKSLYLDEQAKRLDLAERVRELEQ